MSNLCDILVLVIYDGAVLMFSAPFYFHLPSTLRRDVLCVPYLTDDMDGDGSKNNVGKGSCKEKLRSGSVNTSTF